MDTRPRLDLFWFVGTVGIIAVIMGSGTAIGWLAAQKTAWLPVNVWPGLVFSVPNWAFYALVRYTLFLTSQWEDYQGKVGELQGLERLASYYLFEIVAIIFQLAMVLCLRTRRPNCAVVVGCVILIFWISVVCLELLLCAASGYYAD